MATAERTFVDNICSVTADARIMHGAAWMLASEMRRIDAKESPRTEAYGLRRAASITLGNLASFRLPLLFWLFTYAILTVRGRLLPGQPLDWISLKRIVAISLGAVSYALAIRVLDGTRTRSLAFRLTFVVVMSFGGAAAVLASRWAFVGLAEREPFDLGGEMRWLLLWISYLFTWISVYTALDSHKRLKAGGEEYQKQVGSPDSHTAADEDVFIWVQSQRQLLRLSLASVERFEAEGNYVRVHSSEGTGLVREPLTAIEKRLDPMTFARVHRAVICRWGSIRSLRRTRTGTMRAALASGAEVPVGRSMGKLVIDAIKRGHHQRPDSRRSSSP